MSWVEIVPYLAYTALTLALAAALLVFNADRAPNRAFAGLLLLRGLLSLTVGLALVAPDGIAARFWLGLHPFLVVPALAAALWFAIVYPRKRSLPWFSHRGALAILLGLTLLAELALLSDPKLYWDLRGLEGLRAADVVHFPLPKGPLHAAFGATVLAFGALVLVFVRDALSLPAGRMRNSVLLVAMGFALVVAHDAVGRLAGPPKGEPVVDALVAASLVVVALACAILTRVPVGADRTRRAFVPLVVLAAVSGAVPHALPVGSEAQLAASFVLSSLWRFALPLLVAFAILRHQMFGIELGVKRTISRGTLAGLFLASVFVAAKLGENLAESAFGDNGVLLGGIAAGLFLFLLNPLQRFAERVAEAAMPDIKPPSRMSPTEREHAYREAAQAAWADGTLTRKERILLDRLRLALELDHVAASRIEREAADATAPPVPAR
ncbi:MAG TPA: histidine kinase N-terminal 7TM domain-containing protein [Candidatus Thermoplasmatota archaeon]|nr:histidine kinase N-terminal 7TM domain-containing protein [Candidatus Thermoplasmatota archaeon]